MDPENASLRSMADQAFDIIEETDDELIKYDNFLSPDYEPEPAPAAAENNVAEPAGIEIDFDAKPEAAAAAPELNADGTSKEPVVPAIDFDGKGLVTTDEFKAEEALEKLKALGFEMVKAGDADPLQAKEHEITQINQVITNMQSALNLDDLSLCREQVYNDLAEEYKKNGKVSQIGSEEFKLEIEAGMEEFQYTPRLANLQANQVRSQIKEFIQDRTQAKEKINTEVKVARDKELEENRNSLKSTFTQYNNQVLFGQKIDQQTLVTAYQKVVSGDFTKTIEKDRALQAEFALYLELKPKLVQSGNGTYGEGVAATVNALNGSAQRQTPSSLNQTVSRPGAGSVTTDRLAKWRKIGEVPEPETK